jgi:hypothetical protein
MVELGIFGAVIFALVLYGCPTKKLLTPGGDPRA